MQKIGALDSGGTRAASIASSSRQTVRLIGPDERTQLETVAFARRVQRMQISPRARRFRRHVEMPGPARERSFRNISEVAGIAPRPSGAFITEAVEARVEPGARGRHRASAMGSEVSAATGASAPASSGIARATSFVCGVRSKRPAIRVGVRRPGTRQRLGPRGAGVAVTAAGWKVRGDVGCAAVERAVVQRAHQAHPDGGQLPRARDPGSKNARTGPPAPHNPKLPFEEHRRVETRPHRAAGCGRSAFEAFRNDARR